MKPGKVSQTVLKRSVLKEIKYKRPEIMHGASLIGDCSAIKTQEDEIIVTAAVNNQYAKKSVEALCINGLVNNIAASGATALGVLLNMVLPVSFMESDLKEMMRNFDRECGIQNLQIIGSDIVFSENVKCPVINLTGIGKVHKDYLLNIADCRPGQDIVMSKTIGIEGSHLILLSKEEELKKRFPVSFLKKLELYKDNLSVVSEAAVAVKHGVTAMHNITFGGIYGALWNIGIASKNGVSADLKSIPVHQETIEICELFNLNPYQLLSGGSLLMITDNGEELVRNLKLEGISGAVIGKITGGNDKVVLNDDEIRYLEPPKGDEIEKIYQ
jgi:hydrogenase expression/formation protein HypE